MTLILVETGQNFMTQIKNNNDITISNKRLSVQVSLTGLSFFISNWETKEILFFKKKTFHSSRTPEELLIELEEAFSSISELQVVFKDIHVIYTTDLYTVIPSALYDETNASSYLKYNSKVFLNDYVASDIIENHEMVVVYIPFVNINNYIFDRFGSFKYYHSSTVFLKYVLDSEKNGQEATAYVQVSQNMLDLVLVKNGALELCNSYSFSTPEDFIYYILFAFEQLGYNPETTTTHMLGSITEEDDNFKIAYEFIRNITVLRNKEFSEIQIDNTHNSMFVFLNSL